MAERVNAKRAYGGVFAFLGIVAAMIGIAQYFNAPIQARVVSLEQTVIRLEQEIASNKAIDILEHSELRGKAAAIEVAAGKVDKEFLALRELQQTEQTRNDARLRKLEDWREKDHELFIDHAIDSEGRLSRLEAEGE